MNEWTNRVRTLEKLVQDLKSKLQNLPARWAQNAAQVFTGCGKLDGSLTRGGHANASVWKPDPDGGLDADTGNTVKVIDIGMTPVTLPTNTVIVWIKIFGINVVIAYDCSAV